MTFREKLQMEHPECVSTIYYGECKGCPYHYGYEKASESYCKANVVKCKHCWSREIPETEKIEEKKEHDPVNAPNHYCVGGYECWDVMEAVFGKDVLFGFALRNAWKYLWRAGKKDDLLQDLKKAAKNLEKAIEVNEDIDLDDHTGCSGLDVQI